ncbi:unnamed protein product, partial [Rotaria socialis]
KKIYDALQWLNQNNPLYRCITINQSTIDKLPDDDVPECLWATMEISNNTGAAGSESSSYIPDPLINTPESNITTSVPITASAILDVNGTTVSSNDVAEHVLRQMKVSDERINTLMKRIKAIGGHVMGSAHSRSALRTKIHSLCFNLGLPCLFVTINPADIQSPVALYFAGVDLDLDRVLPEVLRISYERAQIIATHPVATAKFFNCLIKSIVKCLVLGGVLGPTKAYFGTVERQ